MLQLMTRNFEGRVVCGKRKENYLHVCQWGHFGCSPRLAIVLMEVNAALRSMTNGKHR